MIISDTWTINIINEASRSVNYVLKSVIDDSRGMLQIVVSLTDDSRGREY
jgi:hypothetical protein